MLGSSSPGPVEGVGPGSGMSQPLALCQDPRCVWEGVSKQKGKWKGDESLVNGTVGQTKNDVCGWPLVSLNSNDLGSAS